MVLLHRKKEHMAKKQNPRELLNDVLRLIAKDVEEIETLSAAGKLEGEVAATLVRYSDALLKIVKDSDGQEDAERQKLSNMSPEELKAKAKEALAKMDKR